MRILLDTNILIHREATIVVHQSIGDLFNWLDRLEYKKCVHPVSIDEIQQYKDERIRKSFLTKINSYHILKTLAPLASEIKTLMERDATVNDLNDSKILNELFAERVDFLITEDQGIFRKAEQLGIAERVFTIESFIEKAVVENPELIEYPVPSVKKALFGNVDPQDSFFDSLRQAYPDFDRWFTRKSEEEAYICLSGNQIVGFLYLKVEGPREPYADIYPSFQPKRRLKIGTFKTASIGYKLGERLLKIVFDNAIKQKVDEIYVTVFPNSMECERLITLLKEFGFFLHGKKCNSYGNEDVYVRNMTPHFNPDEPKLTFPFMSRSRRVFLVAIYPEYHTSLFPDSILKTESPSDFVEHEPHRNAIRKVYISRAYCRDLRRGDILVFYRTADQKPALYHSVVTTLGLVENVHTEIRDEKHFIDLCRKRSVFSNDELRKWWHKQQGNYQPFIIEFLYTYSLPKRPNREALLKNHIIRDPLSGPRGIEEIDNERFNKILELSQSDPYLIVD